MISVNKNNVFHINHSTYLIERENYKVELKVIGIMGNPIYVILTTS